MGVVQLPPLDSAQGFSSSRYFRRAAGAAPFQAAIAPPSSESDGSGITRSGSKATRAPRPSHAGQAP